ncbi:serine carboxypeptidase S28-domain-containing protein [Cunninghamella echinulata]|nr:serine carboxypeptidase S28-domain-containing protein [Cunninghamella echinulata]
MKKLIFILSLCLLSWVQAKSNTLIHTFSQHQLYPSKLVKRDTNSSSSTSINYDAYSFNQPLDHKNQQSTTFQQRYWVNRDYYQSGGPVILYNAGEYNAESVVPTIFDDSVFKLMAQKLNAMLIVIEHRFYGESYPKGLQSPQWSYLTIEQSLEDMANFIRHGDQLKGIRFDCSPNKVKWILRGGSYSGNLAAWMRYKYPDLVYAAVASSAPVQAEMDFYQYYFPIMKYAPSKCAKGLNNVVLKIDDFLAKHPHPSQENSDFKKQFGLEDKESDSEFALYAMNTALNFWQNSPPNENYLGDYICPIFQNSSDPNDHFKNYAEWVKGEVEYDKTEDNGSTTTNTKENDNDYYSSNVISFYHQRCSELGYLPTSPPKTHPLYPRRIMSSLVNEDYWKNECKNKYQTPHNQVSNTNLNYRGWNLSISRTIWIEGEYDNWRELSVLSDANPIPRRNTTLEKYLVIPKGVHVFDFYVYDAINYLHDYTIKTLKDWLK